MFSHKMKWRFLPVLALALGLVVSSCNKEPLEGPMEDLKEQEAQPLEVDVHADPEITTINGKRALSFGNLEHFNNIFESIMLKDRAELDRWERQIGFSSMRNKFEQLEDKYATINSQQTLDQFRDQYRNSVVFTDEGEIEMKVDMYHIASLINQSGIVKIGSMIQQFTKNKVITIGDGDYSKLSTAAQLTESMPDDHMFVSYIGTTTNARSNGPDDLDCQSSWDSDKRRVKMSLEANWWNTPNYYSIPQTYYDYQLGQYVTTYTYVWDGTSSIGCTMELEVKSQKKGFLGIAFASKADIEAKFGANIHETTSGALTNHWMPVSETANDSKKLVKTYSVKSVLISGVANTTFCFGPTHVAGFINGGTNCHVWN